MAKLTAAKRRAIPSSEFAGPGRSFPIEDKVHAQKAVQMSGHRSPAAAAKIKAKVHAKYPGIKISSMTRAK